MYTLYTCWKIPGGAPHLRPKKLAQQNPTTDVARDKGQRQGTRHAIVLPAIGTKPINYVMH